VSLVYSAGIFAFRTLTRSICRVDGAQLAKVPERGPLIIAMNHVHILEIPLIFTHLQPRPVTALVAAKRWDAAWSRYLVEMTGAIPLHRSRSDIPAFKLALEALAEEKILIIAPEGTRSGTGLLQKGLPGVVLLAQKSEAPLLPLVHYGSEDYKRNLSRLRRSDFHIVVGEPFRLSSPQGAIGRQVRRQMADEIMYRMAELLPEEYRGVYSDMSKASQEYILPI